MLWFLILHIVALLLWAAALLYMPLLLAAGQAWHSDLPGQRHGHESLLRFLFTRFATPVALLTIASGSAVFMLAELRDIWMLVKLALVVVLVSCHALLGWLIIRHEAGLVANTQRWARLLLLTSLVLILLTFWLVLAKPVLELPPWMQTL